jgi:hypothetical protein
MTSTAIVNPCLWSAMVSGVSTYSYHANLIRCLLKPNATIVSLCRRAAIATAHYFNCLRPYILESPLPPPYHHHHIPHGHQMCHFLVSNQWWSINRAWGCSYSQGKKEIGDSMAGGHKNKTDTYKSFQRTLQTISKFYTFQHVQMRPTPINYFN